MLKNKKGFTLIEILAAITILGILMAIAIVSVSKVIENGKKKHYTTAEANMVLAGQSFVQQNRAQLPKAIGQKKKIPMTMLIEKNYIQPVMDYSDNECNMAESYVQVFKYSQTDYSYISYLKCPNYDSKENINEITPSITATIIHDENKSIAKAEIEITGNDKLMSYSYIIYRNGKEVKNTGSVQVKNFAESKSINFSLEEYTPGNIKIVITATNTYGNTKTKTVTQDIPDTKKPECVYISAEDEPDHPKTWINEGSRKITIGCDDGETGSGCTRETYTKTFKDSMRTGKIRIEDEDGNYRDCEVSVYIDKINPTITVKAYKKTADDKKTGSAKKTVSTTTTSNSKTIDLSELNDTEWLNNADYPNGVYYELELNDNLELANYKLDRNNTELKKDASNVNTLSYNITNSSISGTSETKWTIVSTDGYRKTKAVITDASGNTAEVMMITPLDRVAPTVPNISMYKWANNSTTPTSVSGLTAYTNDTWSNKYVYTVANDSTDGMSGFKEYKFTTTGKTTNESNATGKTRNIKAEGESKIKYKACDVAGNCSSFTSEKTIKIDKTPPTCEVTGGSTSWINATSTTTKRTITATCVDNGSECQSSTAVLSKDYDSNINTTTAGAVGDGSGGTVYDNAGNSVACEANQTVKIDKSAPSFTTVTNSKDDVWTNGSVVIEATATDTGASGVKHIKYYYDTDSTKRDDWDSGKNTATVKGTWTAERNNTVYLVVTDNAGNTSTAYDAGVVKIDTTPPTAPTSGDIGTVSGSNTAASIATAASGSTDTNGSGVSHYLYYVTDSSTTPTDKSKFGTSMGFTRSCGKSYYAWAIAVDYAGNKSSVKGLGHTSDGANSYTYGSCSAACGAGTKTSTSNSCALITTSSTVECQVRECCAETVTGSNCTSWEWTSCTADCGGGTQYETRSCNKVDKYNTSHACSGTVTETRSLNTSCNMDSCCSEENPYGCDWVTSCRAGNTYAYTSATGSTQAGTVYHGGAGSSASYKLYVLGVSGSRTKVYAEKGDFWHSAYPNDEGIVWIYTNCIGDKNSVCAYDDCPG